MRTCAGILLLLIGLAFPMGMLFWLNGRLSRKPAPRPREIGLLLAFNGVLPVSLILAGLGLLSAAIWAVGRGAHSTDRFGRGGRHPLPGSARDRRVASARRQR